jgi:hypothetical protein
MVRSSRHRENNTKADVVVAVVRRVVVAVGAATWPSANLVVFLSDRVVGKHQSMFRGNGTGHEDRLFSELPPGTFLAPNYSKNY